MTNGILAKHIGILAIGSGLIAASIYWLMMSVTIAHIEAISGLVPFDMRPAGYGPTQAAALLDALGVEGRAYYLSHQLTLDTLYPAMLAVTLIATICWLGQHRPDKRFIRIGIALSGASALFDYAENLGIMTMIWSWPGVFGPLVYAASSATILKSISTTLAVLLVLFLGFHRARHPKATRPL